MAEDQVTLRGTVRVTFSLSTSEHSPVIELVTDTDEEPVTLVDGTDSANDRVAHGDKVKVTGNHLYDGRFHVKKLEHEQPD